MKYVPVLAAAAAALLVGMIVVIVLFVILTSTDLNRSVAFGIALVAGMALGLGVGFATKARLKRMRTTESGPKDDPGHESER